MVATDVIGLDTLATRETVAGRHALAGFFVGHAVGFSQY
jgi:hypothetical protein